MKKTRRSLLAEAVVVGEEQAVAEDVDVVVVDEALEAAEEQMKEVVAVLVAVLVAVKAAPVRSVVTDAFTVTNKSTKCAIVRIWASAPRSRPSVEALQTSAASSMEETKVPRSAVKVEMIMEVMTTPM
ncbi:hypothetical protein PF002_g33275 [Phytophthora fragariae]|uniref:Uncharacterized protein n=1 Tax=Phytophthora fragariae TaxID=53985 RepID=A0A6A3UYR8_9STRA|nr:hypothetical protein PF002_g33275 [Phytophthora fragariae]